VTSARGCVAPTGEVTGNLSNPVGLDHRRGAHSYNNKHQLNSTSMYLVKNVWFITATYSGWFVYVLQQIVFIGKPNREVRV